MEAIREYLNNLFLNIPETSEVLRAKAELMEMMEDKYEELIQDGKSEKEAVGIVISEFGNFEEIASELGIGEYIRKEERVEKTTAQSETKNEKKRPTYSWGVQDVHKYLEFAKRHAQYMALAIALCIMTPCVSSIIDEMNFPMSGAVGSSIFFALVAVAVVLFCYTSRMTKNAIKVKKSSILLDAEGERKLAELIPAWESKRFVMRTAGILLCVFSVIPSCFSGYFTGFFADFLDNIFLVLVAIGVFCIVFAQSVGNRFMELWKASKREGDGKNVQTSSWDYRPKEMPAGAIIAIVLGSIAVAGVVIFSGVASLFGFGSSTGKMTKEQLQYSAESFSKVELDLSACELEVDSVEGLGQVEYEYEGNVGRTPNVKMENGVLKISETGKASWKFAFGNAKRKMIIRVPEDVKDALVYDIQIDAGDIRLNGIHGRQILLDVDAGNIIAKDCRFEGASEFEVDAGNLELLKADFENVNADVNAGNFIYEFADPDKQDEYSLDLHVDLGKVTVGGQNGSLDYKRDGGVKQIKAKVDLGNAEIKY